MNGQLKKKNITVLFVFFFMIILPANSLGNPCITSSTTSIVVGPFPQHLFNDSIIIFWETNIPTATNIVHWGLTPTCANQTTETSLIHHTFHRIRLTNLLASTTYYYKVESDDILSDIYSFSTTYESNQTLQFIAYGDTRGGWDSWKNASIVASAIKTYNPTLVLHTGDFVDNANNKTQWPDFLKVSDYLHNTLLYPVIGNHELPALLYFHYLSYPLYKRWYYIDFGPVHFIGLDSSQHFLLRLVQAKWVENNLKNNNQPFTIVFFHNPIYSSGSHGGDIILEKLWKPVFTRYGVDIVFSGHDHDYERANVDNVTYIVTGGGGAPLRECGTSPWTIYAESTFHFCIVTVNESTLEFSAVKPDGTQFDSFSIEK